MYKTNNEQNKIKKNIYNIKQKREKGQYLHEINLSIYLNYQFQSIKKTFRPQQYIMDCINK